MNRRRFLFGLGAFAAPAIIRPGLLMPVRAIAVPELYGVSPALLAIADATLLEAWPPAIMADMDVQKVIRQMIVESRRLREVLGDHIAAQA